MSRFASGPRSWWPAFVGLALASGCGPRGVPAPEEPASQAGSATVAPADAAEGPGLWAVVIGIDGYEGTIAPCGSARADAHAMADWLHDEAGWGRDRILVLDDAKTAARTPKERGDDPARSLRASRQNLDWAFKTWLRDRLAPESRADDLVVVYYAGQAVALPDGEGVAPLPITARSGDPGDGWRIDRAIDPIAARRRNPIVCWLDTGPSGRGRPVHAEGFQEKDEPRAAAAFLGALARWPGVSAWMAADRGAAAEGPAGGRFTAALRAGLAPPESKSKPNRLGDLDACLASMNADADLKARGFRAVGGIDSGLHLRRGGRVPSPSFDPILVVQRGHGGPVRSVRFHPNGKRLATTSDYDSAVRIWDWNDGAPRVMRALTSHTNNVVADDLGSGAVPVVASVDGDGRLQLTDLNNPGRGPEPPARPFESRALALGFVPGGEAFAILFDDGIARLFRTDRAADGAAALNADVATALRAAPTAEAGWSLALAHREEKCLRLYLSADDARAARKPGDLPAPPGHVEPDGLVSDSAGRRLAAVDGDGRAVVVDTIDGTKRLEHDFGGRPDAVALAPDGSFLAVAVGQELWLVPVDPPPAAAVGAKPGDALRAPAGESPLSMAGACRALSISADGRWLAAAEADADRPRLWRLGAAGEPPAEVDPGRVVGAAAIDANSLAFAPDGRSLVTGDADGGLRVWHLPGADDRAGLAGRRVAAMRGMVEHVAATADGRYLIEVTADRAALLWDLRDGRGATTIAGRWQGAAIVPGESPAVALLEKNDDAPNRIVVFDLDDRDGARRRPTLSPFPRPQVAGQSIDSTLATLAASPDGRLLAAAAERDPVVCVWDAADGRPLYTLDQAHPRAVAALAFLADGRLVTTGGEDGAVKVWDLAAPAKPVIETAWIDGRTKTPTTIASLAVRPAEAGPAQVAMAGLGPEAGLLAIWEPDGPAATPAVVGGPLAGSARAVAYSADGGWLAVGGYDRDVRFVPLAGPNKNQSMSGRIPLGHGHGEAVNALASWRAADGGSVFASGSDDASAKLWKVPARGAGFADPELRGTLRAEQGGPAWLVLAPNGLYDASAAGLEMLSVLRDDKPTPLILDQYPLGFRRPRLADELRRGEAPKLPPKHDGLMSPPGVAIDRPPPSSKVRSLPLRITLEEPADGADAIRLYHNGVLIGGAGLLKKDPADGDGTTWRAAVTLRGGPNRFYAMVERPRSFDGRSEEVAVEYDGPDPDRPGRTHVLAIGISNYKVKSNALKFAAADARELADFLQARGLRGDLGEREVLIDDQVTEPAVDAAFDKIRKAVEVHPEDTVVVFVAGHADALIDEGGPAGERPNEYYFLLRPGFPFPPVGEGPASLTKDMIVNHEKELIKFQSIYANLRNMVALQRLVIVDACRADALANDPGVRTIQDLIDGDALRTRTSYFLATQWGDPAGEAESLKHGLMTYSLLRGMGAGGLAEARGSEFLRDRGSADANGDGYIVTDELAGFVRMGVADLARAYGPKVVQRAGVAGPAPTRGDDGDPARFGGPRFQANDDPFTLLQLEAAAQAPAGPAAAGAAAEGEVR